MRGPHEQVAMDLEIVPVEVERLLAEQAEFLGFAVEPHG